MKKRTKGLIILAAVLVIAIVATVVLTSYNKKQEETESAAASGVRLFETESAIAELSYQLDGETLCFANETAGWVYTAKEAITLDGDVMNAMADMLTTIEADKLVEEDADLGKYGLDAPWQTVNFTLESGATHVLALGDENAAVSGVYAMLDNSGDVYILSDLYTSVFSSEVITLAEVEALPKYGDGSYATYLSFENENGRLELEYHAEPPMDFYTSIYTWFTKVDGEYKPVDGTATETFITYMTSLYAQGVIAIYPDEAELAKYGLDAPEKIGFGFETPSEDEASKPDYTEYTLLVGDRFERDGQNYRYVMQEGGTQVVAMSAAGLDNVMGVKYEDLLPVDICPLLRYQMNTMEVIFGGKQYEIEFKEKTVTDEDGNNNTEYEYVVDGVTVAAKSFLDWYYILSGMTSEGIAEGELAGESTLKIVFHRSEGDGFDNMTMEFYKYDSDFYRVVFGGEDYMLANRRDVEAFMKGITELEPVK